jgi:dipeptidase
MRASRFRVPALNGALAVAIGLAGVGVGVVGAGAIGSSDGPAPADAVAGDRPAPEKSIGFFVGRDLTADGATLLGGFGHEPSSHWLDIVPAQDHPEGATIEVGVTEDARLAGELIEIPQVARTAKYISSTYSEFAGFPPPLTNGGLNEHGVAARDIWSPSRPELVDMTPDPQRGLNYSDLSRIVMERATTAREAAELVGALIDEHGYATYGGNSHLFADEDEGWMLINYAGGEGLWAAERLGPDEVRVSYPGYIHDFPVDFEDDDDFLASDNLVEVALEQGWWDGEGDTLDLQEVYGLPFPGEDVELDEDAHIATREPPEREAELLEMAPVTLEDMLALVRDPRWSNDHAGYGQVAQLHDDVHDELQTLWVATTSAITTPYVPIPIGAQEVPPEFRQHRYMTKDADGTFLDADYAAQEATRYATREFKRLLYFTCDRPLDLLHEVTGAIEGFEQELLAEQAELQAEALDLYQDGDTEGARALLTSYVEERLLDSLELGMDLTDDVEAETRDRYGIREPQGEDVEGDTTPPESQPMHGPDRITCYDTELDEYPREHGIYTEKGERPGGKPFDPPGPPPDRPPVDPPDHRPGPPPGRPGPRHP